LRVLSLVLRLKQRLIERPKSRDDRVLTFTKIDHLVRPPEIEQPLLRLLNLDFIIVDGFCQKLSRILVRVVDVVEVVVLVRFCPVVGDLSRQLRNPVAVVDLDQPRVPHRPDLDIAKQDCRERLQPLQVRLLVALTLRHFK